MIPIPRNHGRTHSLVTLIGLSLLSGDTVTVTDRGVLIVSPSSRLLLATRTRERAQELYDAALADCEEAIRE